MKKKITSDSTPQNGEISLKPSRIRKNKLKHRLNTAYDNLASIQLDKSESPFIDLGVSSDKISLSKNLRNTEYGETKIKNILIEPRQLTNTGKQGNTAFIIEIVGISVAVIGVLVLIAACALYPKRRKCKALEKPMPLYENSTYNSQDNLNSSDSYILYSSAYPKENTALLSTHSIPAQLAPAATHQKLYSIISDDIPTNPRNREYNNNRNITNSVIIDTDNYTYSALKLFSPFKPTAVPKTPIHKNKSNKEQYRSSLKPFILGLSTSRLQNRESTVDPYSSTDSVIDNRQTDSTFSGYEWIHKNGHVIPPKYHS